MTTNKASDGPATTNPLVAVTLDRQPPLPPLTGEQVLPGLAIVPFLDENNQLTSIMLTVHVASGTTVGGGQCLGCRRRNLHLLADIDWDRTLDQIRADPAIGVADLADRDAADRCTADHHQCAEGFCTPMAGDPLIAPMVGRREADAAAAGLETVRMQLAHHATAEDDPCADRGVSWPCDVASVLWPDAGEKRATPNPA